MKMAGSERIGRNVRLKFLSFVIVLLVLPCVVFGAGKSRGVPGGWFEDFEAAKAASAKEGKHILMCSIVSDDYWGNKLFKELYSKSAFSGKAKKHFVLMMVDLAKSSKNLSPLAIRQNPKLKTEYHLWGYGDCVIVDSDGVVLKNLDRLEGDPKTAWATVENALPDLPAAEKKSGKASLESRSDKASADAVAKKKSSSGEPKKKKKDDGEPVVRIAGTGKSTPPGWMDDFYAAQEIARKSDKLLFVVFSGSDWCYWCKLYSEKVLSVPRFVKAVRDRYVLVYVDSPREKSLLSDKCREQNNEVKKILGARGGVPHTIIATPDAEKLVSIGGCNKYAQEGADSFLEYFEKLDGGVKALGKAKRTIREKGLDESSTEAVKIVRDALVEMDEETLIEHFIHEAELVVERDSSCLKDFPYLEFVHPLKMEFNQLKDKLGAAARQEMSESGKEHSYQAYQAAKRKVFLADGYKGKFKSLLPKIDAAKEKLAGRNKTIKSLLDLKSQIYGEINGQ